MRVVIVTNRPAVVGFYGKLPSHGDFVRRRVSDAFVGAWDAWLQEGIAASRWALGERWLEVYLTSPAWRFACAAGTCGPAPVIGLMVPSVDRVGRYFPLTLATELPHDASLITAATAGEPFFDRAERLVIETLAAERVDFDTFDEQVLDLGRELACVGGTARVVLEGTAAAILEGGERPAWQIPVGSSSDLAAAFEQMLSHRLSTLYDPLVLWWSEGSSIIEPSCLVGKGLPHADSFAALLDGSWREREWRPVPARVQTACIQDPQDEDRIAPRLESAAATHVGSVRAVNQDAFLERPEIGVWAVADGLGGHSHGEIASRMVCDALAELVPGERLDDTIGLARQRISEVNEYLVRTATRASDALGSGSTVVALLARGARCAILWAGDSRVYRLRTGRLEQLTRDHSLAGGEAGASGEESHAVTRAVGGEPGLNLDLHLDHVRAGDRFLLCSDGLTRVVTETAIRGWLEHDDIRAAASGLINATLDAGAPDNVTVVVIEAARC